MKNVGLDVYLVVFSALTFLFIVQGRRAYKLTKRQLYTHRLSYITETLKDMITGGADEMTNTTGTTPEENLGILRGLDLEVPDNHATLEDLVKQNDNEEDYESYLAVLTELIQERYKNYRFLRVSPTHEDFRSGYFLSITINRENVPAEYEYLFRLAVKQGLTPEKINDLFYRKMQAGEILALGDVEIVAGTAVSPITQAEDLMVNIVFMPREYYIKHLELLEKDKER